MDEQVPKTLNLKPLVWSEPAKPASGNPSYYDHVFTDTSFGRYMIEWKSWKEYDAFTVRFDGNDDVEFIDSGRHLDHAKAIAAAHLADHVAMLQRKIQELTLPQTPALYYLASPFSHPDPIMVEARRKAVCQKAGELIAQGIHVISPIAHNVAVIRQFGGGMGWDLWKDQDLALLRVCHGIKVLRLPGWEESVGVAAEIAAATAAGLPIEYIDLGQEIDHGR